MYHYRKTRRTYAGHNRMDKTRTDCTFCRDETRQTTLLENETMFVVKNRVSYDMFEGKKVLDHVMVIPKAHHESLRDFTDVEKIDVMNIMAEYEGRGYNIYARGVGSSTRSVSHQHTHMLKLSDKQATFMLYARKPYVLVNL